MKVLQINGGLFGSTGKIMFSLEKKANENGYIVLSCSPETERKKFDGHFYKIQTYFWRKVNAFLDFIFGYNGAFSRFATARLIKAIKKFRPEIIHLHTLHGSFINLKSFFRFIKNSDCKIIWTLHDCWSFTGRCPYFSAYGCTNWKSGCNACPYPKKQYPRSIIRYSKRMWKTKKKLFTSINNLVLATPSKWLYDLVKESFLKDYSTVIIHNGIDLSIFKPEVSSFRDDYGIDDQSFLLLGVAFQWEKRKGLDVFVKLAEDLPSVFKIVLVGTNDEIDKKLPRNIISIHKTNSQKELAKIYTAADLFVNPTIEENYPTVNMESIACGTPVLTYKTGGSPEMLDDSCGCVVDQGNYEALKNEIINIYKNRPFSEKNCLLKAKSFDMNDRFQEYIDLYSSLLK